MNEARTAVVLLSGGVDSATTLAIARAEGRCCHALSFDYGQRHALELQAARQLARTLGAAEHRVFSLELAGFGGSALTDTGIPLPDGGTGEGEEGIPASYVPARNTIFLAIALAWAETLGAAEIHLGVNAVDYSGYPDCRPEYIRAFQQLAALATREGVSGRAVRICAPLLHWSKAQILRRGLELGVDYALTVSCYRASPEQRACGRCDSCVLRREAFAALGMDDPIG